MQRDLLLKLYLDNRSISEELEQFIRGLCALNEHLKTEVAEGFKSHAPCVCICHCDGTATGLAFHGVPSGHEFTPFVLGLYNLSAPGQPLNEELNARIGKITQPTDIKIMVTLSCSMCPDLVKAAQRIAAENTNVKAEVYDIRHFEDLKQKYQIMSVPCMIINDRQVIFGRKTTEEILTLLGV